MEEIAECMGVLRDEGDCMHVLVFYVPQTHLQQVKDAVFASGAGTLGNYSHCSWEIKGEGQFLPMNGADPVIGSVGNLEKVEEYRVEMVVQDELVSSVVQALKESHPYETPAYHLIPVVTVEVEPYNN